MDFVQDIFEFFKTDKADFTYRIIDGVGGYFQNVNEILSFDENAITLSFKGAKLEIYGTKLQVDKYFNGDVAISGKIEKIIKVKN